MKMTDDYNEMKHGIVKNEGGHSDFDVKITKLIIKYQMALTSQVTVITSMTFCFQKLYYIGQAKT